MPNITALEKKTIYNLKNDTNTKENEFSTGFLHMKKAINDQLLVQTTILE